MRQTTIPLSLLALALASGLVMVGCARTLGYAGAHPGYVQCRGKGAISGTGSSSVVAGVGGGGMNGFSLQADCGDGFTFQQGPVPAPAPAK